MHAITIGTYYIHYSRSSQKRKNTSLTSHSPSKRLKTSSREELIFAMSPPKRRVVSPKSPWKLKLLSHTKVVSPQKRVLFRRSSPRKDDSPIPKKFKVASTKKATSPQKLKVVYPSSSAQKNERSLPKVASPKKATSPQQLKVVYPCSSAQTNERSLPKAASPKKATSPQKLTVVATDMNLAGSFHTYFKFLSFCDTNYIACRNTF